MNDPNYTNVAPGTYGYYWFKSGEDDHYPRVVKVDYEGDFIVFFEIGSAKSMDIEVAFKKGMLIGPYINPPWKMGAGKCLKEGENA